MGSLDGARGVLQTAVQQHDRVTSANLHSACEGALRSEVAAVVDDHDTLVPAGQLFQDLGGIVGAGVVDKDDLPVDADLVEDATQPLVPVTHSPRIAVSPGDDAHLPPAPSHGRPR